MKINKILLIKALALSGQAFALETPSLLERINLTPVLENVENPINIGVMDTGFDTKHPLLKNALTTGYNWRDNSFNVQCSLDAAIGQVTSHGTHVAGIVRQVAPDSKIIPFKIGADKNVNGPRKNNVMLKTLQEIAKRPDIQIVNISFHMYSLMDSTAYYKAMVDIAKSNKLIVVSAGNHNEMYGQNSYLTGSLSKLAADPEVQKRLILVSASEKTLAGEFIASWSATAQSCHPYFVMAPGDCISSSVPQETGQDYRYAGGTSMAAPIVCGILAEIMQRSNCTIDEARQYLFDGCVTKRDGVALDKFIYGSGLVNADNSIQLALGHQQRAIDIQLKKHRAQVRRLHIQKETISDENMKNRALVLKINAAPKTVNDNKAKLLRTKKVRDLILWFEGK